MAISKKNLKSKTAGSWQEDVKKELQENLKKKKENEDNKILTTVDGKQFKVKDLGTNNYTIDIPKKAESMKNMRQANKVHEAALKKGIEEKEKSVKSSHFKEKEGITSDYTPIKYTDIKPAEYTANPENKLSIKVSNAANRVANAQYGIGGRLLYSVPVGIEGMKQAIKAYGEGGSKYRSLATKAQDDLNNLAAKYGYNSEAMMKDPDYYRLLNLRNSYNKISNAYLNKPINMSSEDLANFGHANEFKEKAVEGLGTVGSAVGNTLMSTEEIIGQQLLNRAVPGLGTASMYATGAADSIYNSGLQGKGAKDAVEKGIVSGMVRAGAYEIAPKVIKSDLEAMKAPNIAAPVLYGETAAIKGPNNLYTRLINGNAQLLTDENGYLLALGKTGYGTMAKNAVPNILKGGVQGAASGTADYLGQGGVNVLYGDESGITPGGLAQSAASGFLMGAAMRGASEINNAVKLRNAENMLEKAVMDRWNYAVDLKNNANSKSNNKTSSINNTPLIGNISNNDGTYNSYANYMMRNMPYDVYNDNNKSNGINLNDTFITPKGAENTADTSKSGALALPNNQPIRNADNAIKNTPFMLPLSSDFTADSNGNIKPFTNPTEPINVSNEKIVPKTTLTGTKIVKDIESLENWDEFFFEPEKYVNSDDIKDIEGLQKMADSIGFSSVEKMYNAANEKLEANIKKEADELAAQFKAYKPQGVSTVPVQDYQGGVTFDKGYYKTSNNEQWYRDLYKKLGHKPSKKDMEIYADELVRDDMRSGGGQYASPELAQQYETVNRIYKAYSKGYEGQNGRYLGYDRGENGDITLNFGQKYEGIPEPEAGSSYPVYNGKQVIEGGKAAQTQQNEISDPYLSYTRNKINSMLENGEITSKQAAEYWKEANKRFKNSPSAGIGETPGKKESANNINKRLMTNNAAQKELLAQKRIRTSNDSNRYYGHTLSGVIDDIKIEPLDADGHNKTATSWPVTSANGSNTIISDNNGNSNTKDITQQSAESNDSLGIADVTLGKETSRILRDLRKVYQGIVSGQEPLERIDRKTDKLIKKANKSGGSYESPDINEFTQLVRQAGGTVDTILEKGLYDSTGAKVSDQSFESIVKAVPKDLRSKYNDYLQNKHNISRMTLEDRFKNDDGTPKYNNKPVNGKTADESRQIVADYEKNYPEFKKWSDEKNKYWRDFGENWLVKSGMMTEEQFNNMWDMYPDYIPTYRTDKNTKGVGGVRGKRLNTPNAVGKATGSVKEIIPYEEGMAQKINQIVRAVRYNDLYKSIGDVAEMFPDEAVEMGIMRENDGDIDLNSIITMDEDTLNTIKELENGNYSIDYYKNGEKNRLIINSNVFSAIRLLQNSSGLENDILKLTVNAFKTVQKPIKAAITGSNPVFALANMARDIQTYAVNSTGNPITITSNWFKALAESFTGSEMLDEYKAMGGSQAGYFNSSEGMSKALKNNESFKEKGLGGKATYIAGTPLRGINALNENVEMATRFAEYKNNIKKYGNTPEGRRKAALAAAEVTTNFSRSGPITKNFNAGVLYLNAGVQGVDNFARHLKNNPVRTILSAGLALTIPQLILNFWNRENPNYDALDQRTKDTYFLIPNVYDKDENGKAKTFIKLPKSQEYGTLFATLIDRIMSFAETGDFDKSFDGFGNTVYSNLLPNSPINGNIFSPIETNLPNNKDFAGRNIVSPTFIYNNTPPKYQYTATTSGAAKAIANAAQGLPDAERLNYLKSPQQVDYLLNSYTGIVGQELQNATSPKNKGRTAEETARNTLYNTVVGPFENRFIANPEYSNRYTDELYDALDEAKSISQEEKYSTIEETGEEPAIKNTNNYAVTYYNNAANVINDLRKQEQEVLNQPGSWKDKQEKISDIRKKMADVAKYALSNSENEFKLADEYVNGMKNTSEYNNILDDAEREKAIDNLYSYMSIKEKKAIDSGYTNDDDKKIDNMVSSGMSPANAILLKQTLSKIYNDAKESGLNQHDSKLEQTDFINRLNITTEQKKALEDNFVSDVQVIGDEINLEYGEDENYEVSKLSENAQKNWEWAKGKGYTVDEYSQAYDIVWDTTKGYSKESKIADLQLKLGLSYNQANAFWDKMRKNS